MKRQNAANEIGKQLVQVPVVPGIEDDKNFLITESERWDNTRLSLLNAVLDTLVPGARFVCTIMADRSIIGIYLSDCSDEMESRPRDIVSSLHDLAYSIERLKKEN